MQAPTATKRGQSQVLPGTHSVGATRSHRWLYVRAQIVCCSSHPDSSSSCLSISLRLPFDHQLRTSPWINRPRSGTCHSVHVHEGHGATTLAGSGDRATQVFIKVIPTSHRKLPNRLAIWLAMAPIQSKVSVHATAHRLAALSEKPASCSTPHAQQVNSHNSWRHLA